MANDVRQIELSPAEQDRDYERVNGAFDRARAEQVRQYGLSGYKGDPGTDAAERRAEVQGDATMQSLPRFTQSQRDAARSRAVADSPSLSVEAGRQQQVERPVRSRL